MEYRQGSHTKYKIEYHFVWVAKYRCAMLVGDLALRVRELVRQTCERYETQILRGVVSKDHVHILLSAPPDVSPSTIMRGVKGASIAEDIRRISACEEAVLGAAFLGAGLFLCHRRRVDERDDSGVSFASF